ncbi:MAG: phenylalanine--tRNA ligase subunit beta [Candidatus Thorarchaeota archaeon]|nr:MAG: phenylalanine--tRNA ligase subunit beta [Candidatus Thorarchaeota archaeon]RLI59514.1 MAG: phenylalanine--tRNA ligase subunit beta [Candidatus Thorarchaeota archaeon]
MIVDCRIDELLKLIGRKISLKKLEDTLFLLKAEIERVDGNDIQIEVNPDRQDMLSMEGIARAIRAFIDIEPGLKKFPVKRSGKRVVVSRGLEKIRRYISCGIVRDVEINDDLIKDYMQLQEQLTATHGRNRRKASIGLYVLSDIAFPVKYTLRKPDKIVFTPLGHEVEMTGPQILAEHEKGVEYGPIIERFARWPLLVDSDGRILSLPPVINSNTLGRITEETSDIFVEVTGTHLLTVDQALNIMVTSLAQRKGRIESVVIEYPDGTMYETPDLRPIEKRIEKEDVASLLGLDLSDEELERSLRHMGHDARIMSKSIQVKTPAYRTDILHAVDVIEDISIGYGYNRIEPTMPATMTAGRLLPITRLKKKVTDLMIGMEYQEILSYIMTSPTVLRENMLRDDDVVTTTNPKSRDYSVLRNALLPILLDFASQNQHVDYPQKLFEVGDIVIPAEDRETRVDQIPSVCGLVTDVRVNITELMKDIGFLLRNLGLDGKFSFRASTTPTFINGRSADILVGDARVGLFGEVSPEVLSNFEITSPVMAFEIRLPRSGAWE